MVRHAVATQKASGAPIERQDALVVAVTYWSPICTVVAHLATAGCASPVAGRTPRHRFGTTAAPTVHTMRPQHGQGRIFCTIGAIKHQGSHPRQG